MKLLPRERFKVFHDLKSLTFNLKILQERRAVCEFSSAVVDSDRVKSDFFLGVTKSFNLRLKPSDTVHLLNFDLDFCKVIGVPAVLKFQNSFSYRIGFERGCFCRKGDILVFGVPVVESRASSSRELPNLVLD